MEHTVQEPAPKYNFISPKEYLEMERASDEKHEYFDGQVYDMSGASLKHIKIAVNLTIQIGKFLEDKECNVLAENMRTTNADRSAYMYPDVIIVCGKEELEDDTFDTLLNPAVIFEILSPSTQNVDKGRKLLYYQLIPSLKEYFMIDTIKQRIYIVKKQSDGTWAYQKPVEGDGSILIETVQLSLPLTAIYKGTGI
ncbi:MAG: Uma2 family endonuclease [Chitinophagaceae bacterium]|jgi:Uma2 family endonuclease|nr:Uma2 family endonuclease [Chitinophagaceae bacterium]